MGQTIKLNQKANVKQKTDADILPSSGLPVIAEYNADSTIGQTLIPSVGSLPFSIDTTKPQNCWVFINGQRLLPTKDFTFLNIDGSGLSNRIQLNSALGDVLPICISKLGIKPEAELGVDTRFQELYDVGSDETQGYISESSTLTAVNGTPSTGQFRSSIQNRASIPDFANDLKVRMAISRIPIQQVSLSTAEYGPNGESVFTVLNDYSNMIRLVGNWTFNQKGNYGQWHFPSSSTNDYLEVVFWGTGLNVIMGFSASTLGLVASIDGGSEGGNLTPATSYSTVIGGGQYSPNQVVTVVSGLSPGLHTVKVRVNSSPTAFNLMGIEILNEGSNLNVRPGTAYIGNRKKVVSSATSVAYNSGFESITQGGSSVGSIGTRGARVLTYLKSDTTIGRAAYLPNGASATLTGADHTYEDISRVFTGRSFGAGRSNDFSRITTGSNNVAFTLDDGVSTLIGSSVAMAVSNSGQADQIRLNANGAYCILTFVGTGLDIVQQNEASGGSDNYTVSIDGATPVSMSGTGTTSPTRVKIVSGLPYGTHTVKFTRVTAATWTLGINSFIVYQPKKPSLPTGAIELGEYSIPATFVANTTAGQGTMSTGVIRRCNIREITYVEGTGGTSSWTGGIDVSNEVAGFSLTTDRTGAYAEMPFYGTGVDFRFFAASNRSSNISITIDGIAATSTNFPGATFSFYGIGSFSSSTGVMSQNGTNTGGCGLAISGLSLGMHKIRITNNTASSFVSISSIDVIAPIHVQKLNSYGVVQNCLQIGSQGVLDLRNTNPGNKFAKKRKAWAQAYGATNANVSITSTTMVPMCDMSVEIFTDGGDVEISYASEVFCTSLVFAQIYVDGIAYGTQKLMQGSANTVLNDRIQIPMAPGFHKIDVYWAVNAGTGTLQVDHRSMTVKEAA